MGFYSETAYKSSKDDKWTTPIHLYDQLNAEFRFGLDAAAMKDSTLVADNWYGPDHPDETRRDAFKRNWAIDSEYWPVWLNPPYGRTIGEWMAKAHNESKSGLCIVCLVPARTDTRWWHNYTQDHTIRFIKGRLKFGNQPNPAPFPSAIVIMNGLVDG